MFCSKCGKEIADGAAFCGFCGARMDGAAQGGDIRQEESFTKAGKKKKGKGGVVALVILLILVLGAGGAGAVYFTSDGYKSGKSMKQAAECLEAQEYEDALAHYEDALALDSSLAQAYMGSADILLLDEKYGEALELLEKGLKKTKDDEDAQEDLADKIKEVKKADDAAATDRLQQYLDNELAAQYGYADLSAKKQTFDWSASFEENAGWTGVKGIADAEIRDLDADGRDELLLVALDQQSIILSVYEVEDNAAVKKAELQEARCTDMFGYDVLCAMVEGQGTDYLLLNESSWGILTDGYSADVKLYRYDGTSLYTPLAVLQTSGGSSDFAYTAYQYDENGSLLSEEVVYDEVYDHETQYDSAHCYERMGALFGDYGLALDSGAAISGEKEIFDDLSASAGYKELFCLDMWGDYRGDGAVYHFNDWDSPLLVYEDFLKGKRTVHVGAGKWLGGQGEMDLTFQDMLKSVEDVYLEYSDKDTVSRVEYAYLDCGGDGVEELALRFVGLDIYSPGDDSDFTLVISNKDGALELLYSCESWARSYTEVNCYGCIYSSGSSGAGDHMIGLGYINADGVIQTVYSANILGGWWVSYISDELYREAFGNSNEPDMEIAVYYIDDSVYYVSALGDYATQKCLDYVTLLQMQGMQFVQEQEIGDIITQHMTELGIKEEWLADGNELYWRQWWY